MPAEIDTGRPRVLHCVERADCPTPRTPPTIIYSSSSSSSWSSSGSPFATPASSRRSNSNSLTRRTSSRQPRHRRCSRSRRSTTTTLLLIPGSADEPSIIPGNDEHDKFLRDQGSSLATSSNDLRQHAFDGSLQHRKRDDDLLRPQIVQENHRTTFAKATTCPNVSISGYRDDPNLGNREKDALFFDDTRQRLSHHSTATSTCRALQRVQQRQSHLRETSVVVIRRVFDGCGGCSYVENREKTCNAILNRDLVTAANSSQCEKRPLSPDVANVESSCRHRRRQCYRQTFRDNHNNQEFFGECACQCVSSDHDGECPVREWSSNDQLLTVRTGPTTNINRHRRKTIMHTRQPPFYYHFQLVLILFLIAFGHNFSSFVKLNCGGRAGVSTIGISALTYGTYLVGAAGALPIDLDAGVRAERSANLSHMMGSSRKILMYVKNRHLQILPNGFVNGTSDEGSDYAIFKRTSVSPGKIRMQAVATCLYLCMDSCGLLYGSRNFSADCVFNERFQPNHYNTYSSVRWSTPKKTLYLGLDRLGQPRRVQVKGSHLGRLSSYTGVLTHTVALDRLQTLENKMLGASHNVRHHHSGNRHRGIMQHNWCPSLHNDTQESDGTDTFRCLKRKKRKKRKRRCREDEKPGPQCDDTEEHASDEDFEGPLQSKRPSEGEANEELTRKQILDASAKKRKSRMGPPAKLNGGSKKKQQRQRNRGKEVKPKKAQDGTKDSNSGESTEGKKPAGGGQGGRKRVKPPFKQGLLRRKGGSRKAAINATESSTTSSTVVLTSSNPSEATTPPVTAAIETDKMSSWKRMKSAASPKNAVTSGELKISGTESTRNGKALQESLSESLVSEIDDLVNDTSAETSEEQARSHELILDDDPTSSSAEYPTIMTMMDTTPPERTKDYTRATSPMPVSRFDEDEEDTPSKSLSGTWDPENLPAR